MADDRIERLKLIKRSNAVERADVLDDSLELSAETLDFFIAEGEFRQRRDTTKFFD